MYLAFLVDQLANHQSTIAMWNNVNTQMSSVFSRQAIPMTWDFAESNLFCHSSGSYHNLSTRQLKAFGALGFGTPGVASQRDAANDIGLPNKIVSTDPPYYDNIGYAALSDYFYVWTRRALFSVYPDALATLSAPKHQELVATPHRHDSKEAAETFFLRGMQSVMGQLSAQVHPVIPCTIYYAFKQSETISKKAIPSTGWETFLSALSSAGFSLQGTWPFRTEFGGRSNAIGSNAFASSIILVCRPRPSDAPVATRGEFRRRLEAEFPEALRLLQTSNIAPVDLTQASIGPGMRIFTEYARVEKSDGTPMSVREALAMINETLDEVQVQQEGDFDADTRWAATWLNQHGFDLGDYGEAETLSKARNTSVAGLVEAGVVESRRGQVALILPEDLDPNWIPQTDSRKTVWEMTHHLIRVLETRGEREAGELMRQFQFFAESARDLAYRLYSISERHNRASDARRYNALIQSWPEVARLSREDLGTQQALLDGD